MKYSTFAKEAGWKDDPIPDSALQRLGGRLADLLDEDQWNNIEKNFLLPALAEREALLEQVADPYPPGSLGEHCLEMRRERDGYRAALEQIAHWADSTDPTSPEAIATLALLK